MGPFCRQAELERELVARGLPKLGLKQELVDRLHAALTGDQQAQQGQQGPSAAAREGPAPEKEQQEQQREQQAGPQMDMEMELAKLTKASRRWVQ